LTITPLSTLTVHEQEAQEALSRSPEAFAQNVINYMTIIWIIHAKLIVFLK